MVKKYPYKQLIRFVMSELFKGLTDDGNQLQLLAMSKLVIFLSRFFTWTDLDTLLDEFVQETDVTTNMSSVVCNLCDYLFFLVHHFQKQLAMDYTILNAQTLLIGDIFASIKGGNVSISFATVNSSCLSSMMKSVLSWSFMTFKF